MMLVETRAIVCSSRLHGEHGAIVRVMSPDHGMMVGYVRGARSRAVRPLLIASNEVAASFNQRHPDQLASLTVELIHSRGPIMGEALAAAALDWVTALSTATLPENQPYPAIFVALDGVIRAIEAAPSARRWAVALVQYEQLILAELGFGRSADGASIVADWPELVVGLARTGERIERHLLSDRRADIMAARTRLIDRLKRAVA
jgi:DNA repair protein RecO (recombination protein O)